MKILFILQEENSKLKKELAILKDNQVSEVAKTVDRQTKDIIRDCHTVFLQLLTVITQNRDAQFQVRGSRKLIHESTILMKLTDMMTQLQIKPAQIQMNKWGDTGKEPESTFTRDYLESISSLHGEIQRLRNQKNDLQEGNQNLIAQCQEQREQLSNYYTRVTQLKEQIS